MRVGGRFQYDKAAEELNAYLQSFCEDSRANVAETAVMKVELFDVGTFLSENDSQEAADRVQNACIYRAMGHSYLVPHLENHAQHTCLHVTEAFAAEVELSDRWVVSLELGDWNATELLQ